MGLVKVYKKSIPRRHSPMMGAGPAAALAEAVGTISTLGAGSSWYAIGIIGIWYSVAVDVVVGAIGSYGLRSYFRLRSGWWRVIDY
jgi:hypothetical protein